MNLKTVVYSAAIIVFIICVYAFLLGTKLIEGRFENEPISWYFLAKGIFCGLSLYMSYLIFETLRKK